jgi:hypothetical protein
VEAQREVAKAMVAAEAIQSEESYAVVAMEKLVMLNICEYPLFEGDGAFPTPLAHTIPPRIPHHHWHGEHRLEGFVSRWEDSLKTA